MIRTATSSRVLLIHLGLALLTIALLLVHCWDTFPNPWIDIGREVYVPWRLAHGQALYRDIAYLNGPLSPYFNALIFACFGSSLSVLKSANLFFLCGTAALIYALFSFITSRNMALLLVLIFLTLFAFGCFELESNFNYLAPYSHEMTHGIFLALLSLYAAARFRMDKDRRLLVLSGMALGLVFLTKPEIFLALCAGQALLIGLSAGNDEMKCLNRIAIFVLAAVVPLGVAVFGLWTQSGFENAARGVAGAWPYLIGGEKLTNFYAAWSGLNTPGQSIKQICVWAMFYVALGGSIAGLSFVDEGSILLKLLYLATAALAFVIFSPLWSEFARPFTLFLICIAFLELGRLRGTSRDDNLRVVQIFRAAFAAFAVVLTLKMGLYTRVYHYGFALAMPGTLLVMFYALQEFPDWIGQRGGRRTYSIACVGGLLFLPLLLFAAQRENIIAHKNVRVQLDDGLRIAPENVQFKDALAELLMQNRPGSSLAVLPEGALLNVMTQRPNSTRFVSLMPLEMSLYGEENVVAEFAHHPPDAILVLPRNVREYGLRGFGDDYALKLMEWINLRYSKRVLTAGGRGDLAVLYERKG